jgi:hypothetical protein
MGDELPGSFMEFMMEGSSANVAHVERFELVPLVVSVTTLKPQRIQPTLQGNGGGNDNKLTEKCPR